MFLHEHRDSMFPFVIFFFKYQLSLLITLSPKRYQSKKNSKTKLFSQFLFSSIILYVSLTSSFLIMSILVTAHLILRLSTFIKIYSASFAHLSILVSIFAPTLVHGAHSCNKSLLYIKHYTPSSHISIVNSSFRLKV